jgi:anti-sigma B factor antagonist
MTNLAEVAVSDHAAAVLVAITGEIDLTNARQINTTILSAARPDATTVVVDLTGVAYLDSAGIRLLYRATAALADRRQLLVLAVPEESRLRDLLAMTGVLEAITVVSDAASGLAAA